MVRGMSSIGDYEAEVRDRTARRTLAAWASIWFDLRTASLMAHARTEKEAKYPFERLVELRAMLDGALITYGRCFTDGTRRSIADVEPLIVELGAEAERTHSEAMRLRHRHLAHRLDPEFESTSVHYLWPKSSKENPTIRIRVTTYSEPGDESFAARLNGLCEDLASLVWRERMWPFKSAHLEELGAEQLLKLRERHAIPYRAQDVPQGMWKAELDLGAETP
jgi:hypothetical protein